MDSRQLLRRAQSSSQLLAHRPAQDPVALAGLRSSGQPLDAGTRSFMEPRFGHDFSRVRVHVDGGAADAAHALGAQAYTIGWDIAFGANKYAPATVRGRELLAHELAHTIQQRAHTGAPGWIQESTAEAAARDVTAGQALTRELPACGVGLARAPVSSEVEDDEELAKTPAREPTLSLLKPDPVLDGPRFSEEALFKDYKDSLERIDDQFRTWRETAKIPYETRLYRARKSLEYYERDHRRQTAEQVWERGFASGLFFEGEKEAVYADQNALQDSARRKREKRSEQQRNDYEIQRHNAHVARGRQLSSPAPVLQAGAFAAIGAGVGAAYAGIQTGAMIGQAYRACADGTAGDCAAGAAPLVAAGVVASTMRGMAVGARPKPPALPSGTTIKASPPPPPAAGPRTTIKASPPPLPAQSPMKPRIASREAPSAVSETEVITLHGLDPARIRIHASSNWHAEAWRYNGGSGAGPPPIAYRLGEFVAVDIERWLASPRPSIGVQLRPGAALPPWSNSKPVARTPPKAADRALEMADTGQAPAPVKGPRTAPASKESQQQAAPRDRQGARLYPKDPPQAISPEAVRRLGARAQFTIDRERHQQAWQLLGGRGDAPPAFFSEGVAYVDPTRWTPPTR